MRKLIFSLLISTGCMAMASCGSSSDKGKIADNQEQNFHSDSSNLAEAACNDGNCQGNCRRANNTQTTNCNCSATCPCKK